MVSNPEVKEHPGTESRPGVSELVRVRGRSGLYVVRGIDQEGRTVHVLKNIPRRPVEEDVPLEAICRFNEDMAQVIAGFLAS